ncbi:hypothetical protein IFM89_036475 [Coptis chinensis]|uniref:Uncharacterized protein n=1 Tax=Coptis chinensis TaxID=261450 RepID=A0A835IZJ5_9MAGN|nr:hypothetical protein IFM89_036475 [Coptis chinensis]
MSSSRAPAAEGGAGDDKLILSPLWNHVEKISKAPGGGGNYKEVLGLKNAIADPQTPKIFKSEHENALKRIRLCRMQLNQLQFHYRKFTMERSFMDSFGDNFANVYFVFDDAELSVSYMLALKA